MSGLFKGYAGFMPRELKFVEGMETGPIPPWSSLPCPERTVAFPEDPTAPGCEPGTMAVWEWVAQLGVTTMRGSPSTSASMHAGRIAPVRKCNTAWLDTVRDAHMRDNWHLLLADGSVPAYDFRLESPELYEAAHVLAHYRMEDELVACPSKELETHGRLAEEYHKACAEIVLSELYGIPVDVKSKGRDIPMAFGIMASPCTATGFEHDYPVLRMPCRNTQRIANHTGLYVLVVIYVGHDPAYGNDFENKFAYRPRMAVVAGVETPGYLAACPLAWPDMGYYDPGRRTGDFACPVHDLLPSKMIEEYLDSAKRNLLYDGRYMAVSDWITTAEYFARKAVTPPMPCYMCAYTSSAYGEGLVLPGRSRRPGTKDEKRKWTEYFRAFKRRMSMARRALKDELAGQKGRRRAFEQRIMDLKRRRRRLKKW